MKWHWAVDNACLMEVALGLTPSSRDIMPQEEIYSMAFHANTASLDSVETCRGRKEFVWL